MANCIHPLVASVKEDAPNMIQHLLSLLLESENYGERKGAAYGLAGLIKGMGLLSLKQLDVMSTLTEALQNKKNPRCREGKEGSSELSFTANPCRYIIPVDKSQHCMRRICISCDF